MKIDRYEDLEVSTDSLEYKFISIGSKGEIVKVIQFKSTSVPDIFNLAFGNQAKNKDIDDLAVDDNKDRNKILATVVSAIYQFTKQFPENLVFFTGSTNERTRLYRMAITLNYDELTIDFEIFGILKDIDSFVNTPFQKGVDYFGFLIKRK